MKGGCPNAASVYVPFHCLCSQRCAVNKTVLVKLLVSTGNEGKENGRLFWMMKEAVQRRSTKVFLFVLSNICFFAMFPVPVLSADSPDEFGKKWGV